MSVVTGALGSLAPKLLQLLHGEYKLQKGVRNQVEWIHSELESIRPFLNKVSDVPWNQLDEQVKVWAREVREASYDVEDIIDTYLVRIDGGQPTDPNKLKSAMRKMGKVFTKAKARHSIAHAIEDIKKQLEEIAQRRQKYNLEEIIRSKPVKATSTIDPHLTAMCKELTQLIGVENSRDQVISMLNPCQPNDDAFDKKITKKVSIVGVGGLGKTTLARVVYDNLKLQYDCAAFVSVGRDLELVKVFKDILYDLDKEKYRNIHKDGRGVRLLILEVQEFLKNKRYFIVIDDVWDVRTWEAIKLSLIENNCGSRVITTTRKFDVANEAGDVYKLKPLSNDDSMKLFYTRIFREQGKYHDNEQDDVINKILKKCGGIPLAIMTMASLLAGKQKYQWSEVLNSIGFASKDKMEAEDTMTILSVSYYDMPPDLRTCLVYLSTYPEDQDIEKDSLIWKWIAEGFIVQEQEATLFELGERYFNDLINRSLIQIVDTLEGRVSKRCRIHDMVLDMIRKLASDENFLALLRDNLKVTCAPSNIRRLAHQNIRAKHKNSDATVAEMTNVRSYNTFLCSIHNLDQFLRFKVLRVLDIVDCSFEEDCHLDHLGDLLHLRYLGIRRCRGTVPELPKQVGNLKLLQTIDVDTVLPDSIVQLSKLLRLRGGLMDTQDGIGNLTSLQELIIISDYSLSKKIRDIPKRFLKELGRLVELRVLEFNIQNWDGSKQRDFVESLCNLKKIKHILVNGHIAYADTAIWEEARFVLPESLCSLVLLFKFSKMPSCIDLSRLPCLSHLSLWVLHMDEHDLRLLAKLPELCYLYLSTESTVTLSNINDGDGSFFRKLRYFGVDSETMVQFEQPNEKDASVSLHIWNGKDAMPFVSRKSTDSSKAVVPRGVMPNLEVLQFTIPLQAIKDNNGDCAGSFGVEFLPSLRELCGWFNFSRMRAKEEVVTALAALRNACKAHPNNPRLHMNKTGDADCIFADEIASYDD